MPLPTQQRLNDHLVRWEDIPGYEGRYQVSTDGQVRSLPNAKRKGVRILKQTAVSGGYLGVTLCLDGHKRPKLVHRLIALTFLGEPRSGQEVCHWNGIRTDNRLTNLRWGTRHENQMDVLRHGHNPNFNRKFCPRGHARTKENIYRRPNGRAYCRVCHREDARRNAATNTSQIKPTSGPVE